MQNKKNFPQKLTALLIYGRPPLVLGGMLCAITVMWNRSFSLYMTGVFFLLVSMSFDVVDGWFAARYPPHITMANLADRVMDKIVYAIIFPLVSVGMMWRLIFIEPTHARPEILHSILVLVLCITVLVRDSFAHFVRGCAVQKGFETETVEFTRLRTMVAAPVGALLYIHAFYLPGENSSVIYLFISWLADLPRRTYLIIEIVFLIINFGSIAGLCRKYGTLLLDEVCHEDDLLRRRILAFFPNALTVLNALMGILAVLFTHQGLIRQAYLFLVGAAIFDKLDGALARKLGLTEPSPQQKSKSVTTLGGLLDDIADGISFCLAPALIFHMTLADYPIAGLNKHWPTAVAAAYFFLGITRLIYFTIDRSPIPGFFKGMPTPAAALLVVAPLLMFTQASETAMATAVFWAIFCFAIMIVSSIAMNLYPVHYLHIGRFMDSNPWFGRFNMLLLLIFLFTPYFGYIALLYLLLYLASPILTRRMEPGYPKKK